MRSVDVKTTGKATNKEERSIGRHSGSSHAPECNSPPHDEQQDAQEVMWLSSAGGHSDNGSSNAPECKLPPHGEQQVAARKQRKSPCRS